MKLKIGAYNLVIQSPMRFYQARLKVARYVPPPKYKPGEVKFIGDHICYRGKIIPMKYLKMYFRPIIDFGDDEVKK